MSRTYRADVDGLRAVSIGLVVAFHAGVDALAGGYVGVDVFFVLSGYLITGLLLAEAERTGRISLRQFVARRARRLLPLAGVVLAVTTVIVGWLSAPVDRPRLFDDLRAAALFVANWRFASSATDYSDVTVTDSPVNHWWSLAVEEQFYLVWPLVILGLVMFARRRSGDRDRSLLRPLTTAMILVVIAASLTASVVLTERLGPAAYYLTHTRLWELGVGALLATVLRRRDGREIVLDRALREPLAVAGLTAIVVAAMAYDATTPFPGTAAILPVAGTAAMILAGSGGVTFVGRVLSLRPMVRLGQWSYAWYLWHWPAIGIALLAADRYGWGWSTGSVTAVAVSVSLALAAVSHRYVENPIRHASFLAAVPRRSVAAGLIAVAAPVALATTLTATLDTGDEQFVLASGVVAMSPQQAAEDTVDLPGSNDCNATIVEDTPGVDCVFGDPEGTLDVVLIGDSHAQHWLPALDVIGRERSWRIHARTKSACGAIPVVIWNDRLERRYRECEVWHDALDTILADLRPDLVVAVNTHGYARLLLDESGDLVEDPDEITERWAIESQRSFARWLDMASGVVRLGDTPWPTQDVPRCLSEHPDDPTNCAFDREARARRDRVLLDAERIAIAGLDADDRIAILDPTTIVCPEPICQVVRPDGTVVFRDGHHLTQTFSVTIAEDLAELLAPTVTAVTRLDP